MKHAGGLHTLHLCGFLVSVSMVEEQRWTARVMQAVDRQQGADETFTWQSARC
jgi:hypothetical protein